MMDIDLVYLWCDGSQPQMLEKRLKAERELGVVRSEEVVDPCHYISTDELKFSLRSVDQYAPWIRRIFIIVDQDQILPDWLNAEGTKITIVRDSEIMTPDMLPTFNSTALTFRIPFIEDLAEHFLFANDDWMLARDVRPEHFFTATGDPIVYYGGKRNDNVIRSTYQCHLINCENTVVNALGVNPALSRVLGHLPHHNVQGIRKSHLLDCHRLFAEQIEATCHSKFRTKDNLQEWLMSCYALATGHGKARLARDLRGTYGPAFADSLTIDLQKDICRIEELLEAYRPLMFCVNDKASLKDEDRLMMKDRLSRIFRQVPPWEVEQAKPYRVHVSERAPESSVVDADGPINIALSCHANAFPTQETLKTLAASKNSESDYRIHIVANEVAEDQKTLLLKCACEKVRIEIVDIETRLTKEHLLCKLPELFPNLNRLLFIRDSLVCRDDVGEIYRENLGGYHSLSIAEGGTALCGGVVLLNLQKMRADSVLKTFEQVREDLQASGCSDLDIYEVVFKDTIRQIPDDLSFRFVNLCQVREAEETFRRRLTTQNQKLRELRIEFNRKCGELDAVKEQLNQSAEAIDL